MALDINIINNARETPLYILVSEISGHSDSRLKLSLEFFDHRPKISIPMLNGSGLFETFLENLSIR